MTDASRHTLSPTGAREGESWFSRILARAVARDLRAFVVPGEEIAGSFGLDLERAGFTLSATPRHANVLVIVGRLASDLERAAAVAYAQMPRPRAILTAGEAEMTQLTPDVTAELDQNSVLRGVEELRDLLARSAFQSEVSDFEVAAIMTEVTYTCAMHPEIIRDDPGSCPICGMELIQRESGKKDNGDLDSEPHEAMHHSHSDMEHSHMDHGDMDFMSMVEMTKDLQRSRDGLPMERVEAGFGPFFPGLPGGLALDLTLDGDAVVEANARSLATQRPESFSGAVAGFPDRIGKLDVLSTSTCRLLAINAIEDAGGLRVDHGTQMERVVVIERERVASHLGWLTGLGRLLGYKRLQRRANALQLALIRGFELRKGSKLETDIRDLMLSVRGSSLLSRRLRGVGRLPSSNSMVGPVARASGIANDARVGDPVYSKLGFEPVIFEEGDALARLGVRLFEVETSLNLLAAMPQTISPENVKPLMSVSSGEGGAGIETARGVARLHLKIEAGKVNVVDLTLPSQVNLSLIGNLADDTELSDFLVSVSSLDISPWGVRNS